MPKAASSKPARQRRPSTSDDQRRVEWKKFAGEVFDRRRRPATREIAAKINELLGAVGTEEEVSQPTVNHWLSKPGKTALRVPSTARLANALVAALERIEIWKGVVPGDAEREKTGLVELLGFKVADVTAPATGALPAKTRLQLTLEQFVTHLNETQRCGLMQVHSCTGFHASLKPEVAEIVFKAIRDRMHCCYVLHEGWNESPPRDVRSELRRGLTKVAETVPGADGGWRSHFWTVEFPMKSVLPLTTLFARTAVLSSFPATPPFSAANGLDYLLAAGDVNIVAYWAEFLPDVSRGESVEDQVWRFSSEQSAKVDSQFIRRFLRQMHRSLEDTSDGKRVAITPLFL